MEELFWDRTDLIDGFKAFTRPSVALPSSTPYKRGESTATLANDVNETTRLLGCDVEVDLEPQPSKSKWMGTAILVVLSVLLSIVFGISVVLCVNPDAFGSLSHWFQSGLI